MKALKLIKKILFGLLTAIFLIYYYSFIYGFLTYREPVPPTDSKETYSQVSKIINTKDAGYLVAGFISVFNYILNQREEKVWLAKLDRGGNKVWQRNLDLKNVQGLQELADGTYIITGSYTYRINATTKADPNGSMSWDDDGFYLFKVNNAGRVEWKKRINELDRDAGYVHATDDGGFVVASNSKSSTPNGAPRSSDNVYWLGKFNKDGKPDWYARETDYHYTASSSAQSVDADRRGGYLIAGGSSYNGGFAKVVHINSEGRLLWRKYFEPTPEPVYAAVFSIKASPDGSSVFVGKNGIDVWGYEDLDSTSIWVEKIDSAGNELWQKMIVGDRMILACELQNTADQGYVVIASTSSTKGYYSRNHGGKDVLIIKLRNNGSVEWEKLLGGSGDDVATGIEVTPDDGYIIAANTTSANGDVHSTLKANKGWIIKLDVNGVIQWEKTTGNL